MLRQAIIPTARQQGISEPKAARSASGWGWAKLLQRVFDLDMATCPVCQQGSLRLIAAITQAPVIRKILRHLKLSADPPPMAPARICQGQGYSVFGKGLQIKVKTS